MERNKKRKYDVLVGLGKVAENLPQNDYQKVVIVKSGENFTKR